MGVTVRVTIRTDKEWSCVCGTKGNEEGSCPFCKKLRNHKRNLKLYRKEQRK